MGLQIKDQANAEVTKQMYAILQLKGMPRLMMLLDILNTLSATNDKEYISNHLIKGENMKESERLSKVFDYVMKNFLSDITIAEVAALVNMA